MLENLITDRTQNDYIRWQTLRDKGLNNMTVEELDEWTAGMKGAYNASDLNRVGEVLNYLHGRLKDAGYITYQTTFTAKTNWNIESIPTAEELTHYLKCVSNVREAMTQKRTTPPTPTDMGALNFEEANNIEKILLDIDELIKNMLAARHFLGELYSGEI